MTKPDPLKCEADQCKYQTPENLATHELQIRHLELHFKTVHEISRNNSNETASRPDKLPRPCLEEGISEADWVWFEEQWKRYKRSTGLKGENIIDHLWTTATPGLARRCYEAGNADKITEDELLKRMKKLAISSRANTGTSQNAAALSRGKAMSGAPIIVGINRLLRPFRTGKRKRNSITVPCIV